VTKRRRCTIELRKTWRHATPGKTIHQAVNTFCKDQQSRPVTTAAAEHWDCPTRLAATRCKALAAVTWRTVQWSNGGTHCGQTEKRAVLRRTNVLRWRPQALAPWPRRSVALQIIGKYTRKTGACFAIWDNPRGKRSTEGVRELVPRNSFEPQGIRRLSGRGTDTAALGHESGLVTFYVTISCDLRMPGYPR